MFRLFMTAIFAFAFIATVRFIWVKWLKNFLEKEEEQEHGDENSKKRQ